jgi:S-adenosyl-L-methionine hydrolase (adenosine-forming)
VLATDELLGVVELTNRAYWRVPEPSATFHGRDIFAPVAAHLANGVPLMNLGPAVAVDTLVQLTETEAIATATGWQGMVQYIDRFGNAATTIPAEAVAPGPWTLTVGGTRLPGAHTYDAVPPGGGLALVGSHGFVEIAINQGSAATRFRLGVGDRVSLPSASRGRYGPSFQPHAHAERPGRPGAGIGWRLPRHGSLPPAGVRCGA